MYHNLAELEKKIREIRIRMDTILSLEITRESALDYLALNDLYQMLQIERMKIIVGI